MCVNKTIPTFEGKKSQIKYFFDVISIKFARTRDWCCLVNQDILNC